jgi:hypothetical protein
MFRDVAICRVIDMLRLFGFLDCFYLMALEKRGNNFYYYEKIREGDKVRSVYSGKGETAYFLDLMRQWKNDEKHGKNTETETNKKRIRNERIKNEHRKNIERT